MSEADPAARHKGHSRHSGFERDRLDWYVEPAFVVDQLLDHEDFSGLCVYDPSCGRGTILDACKQRGLRTYGSDVVDRGAKVNHDWQRIDFLRDLPAQIEADYSRVAIINNPPYGRLEENMPRGDTYAERFVRKALSLGAAKVAMVVNGKFLWSERRWRLFHADFPPTQILFCSDRPSMPPGEELPRLIEEGRAYQGGSIDYVWLLWVKGTGPRPPAWLKPRSLAAEPAAGADLFTSQKDS
jgi:hypothetical protein